MTNQTSKIITSSKYGITRYDWIDSLKGMAIILVIIGHLNNISSELDRYIYSFHMPLFFFISGYLFNFEKYVDIGKEYLVKKIYSLIVPYFFFSVISYVFYIIMDSLYQPQIQNIDVFKEGILFNIYVILFSANGYLINTPLWFLPCLFVTEILFFILRKYFKHDYMFVVIIVLFSFIGFLYPKHVLLTMPWDVDTAFTAIVFYSTGYFFRRNYENILFRTNYFFILFLFLIHITLSFINPRVDMHHLNNYFLFYIMAFSGILIYTYIFKMIKPSNILKFYGNNSLTILGFHYLILSILKYLLPPLFKFLNLEISEKIILIIKIGLTLLIFIPIIIITNRYFPYVMGKRQMEKRQNEMLSE